MINDSIPTRFYLIDALRGLAALSVVIFHYHHFYLSDYTSRPDIPASTTFPWAGQFQLLYDHGHLAVELFWIISGFVFAHVYLGRKTTIWQFSIARFARLYPLHLATLCAVMLIQVVSLNLAGHWQVYGNNDLRHFGLQLLFASNWTTLSRGLSFNGPIWSVSYEMFAYALFLALLVPLRRWGILAGVGISTICWVLAITDPVDVPGFHLSVLTCAGYFFTGCVALMVFVQLRDMPLFVVFGAVSLIFLGTLGLQEEVSITAVSVGVILILAVAERPFATFGSRLAPLGDSSYSIYLIHVPIQMCILLAADLFWDGDRSFADAPVLLPLFLVSTILIAHFVFKKFERPVGRAIRTKLSG